MKGTIICWLGSVQGSISEGKYADFVILDKDPQKTSPNKIDNIGIIQTWMNGHITYSVK